MSAKEELRERRLAVVREHMQSENDHQFDVTLGTFAHPRYELIATGESFDGADEVADYYAKSRASFPDQRNENTVLHDAGDAVVAEFDLLGTHEGELRGIAPTGRSFRCRMCAIFEFEPGSDRIVCERVYFDQTTIAQQLLGDAPAAA
ncbi:MAG TPA: ester cyclase [Solirubrobacteraceae bacterium]|nr:ester cyclase [Solirubrobacteraceae bacterium]